MIFLMNTHVDKLKENTTENDVNGYSSDRMLLVDSGIEVLLSLLAQYGGKIIRSNELDAEVIAQARGNNRMCVDKNGLGYIWEPSDSFERYSNTLMDTE